MSIVILCFLKFHLGIMKKHNRNATIISMILGFMCLALFLDGLLRILGIIPPFLGLDVNVIDQIVDKVRRYGGT